MSSSYFDFHARQLSWVLDRVPPLIVLVDPQGTVLYVNAAYTRLMGYAVEEVVGKHVQALPPGRRSEEAIGRITEALREGKETEGEIELVRKDGRHSWQRFAVAPVRDENGVVVHYLWISTEVTREKELEGQLFQAQKMEAIGQLAGGIAHDFNNILTVILGFGEIIKSQLRSDDASSALMDAVLNAARKAGSLTHQLLAFGRRQILNPTVVDANLILRGLQPMLSRVVGENVAVSNELAADLHRIKIDETKLEQVLMNLVVNARDAIEHSGSILIKTASVELKEDHVDFRPEIKPGLYAMISVTDDGIGMDAETAGHVFEPFFTTKPKGTGLGLSTVYGIVKQSDGYVYVHSHPGKGTTFKVFFPAVEGFTNADAGTRKGEPANLSGDETVLVVDDDEDVCGIMARALTDQGYDTRAAYSAEDARRICETSSETFDLLVTDIVLPDTDGLELSRQLRVQLPALKTLYVTGYSRDFKLDEDTRLVGNALIEKPFGIRDFLVKVRGILDEKEQAS